MPALPVMPIVNHPPTKPNGDPYTVDDPQFWELRSTHMPHFGGSTGIREHRHYEFPKMVYKATTERTTFTSEEDWRKAFQRQTVESQRELDALIERDPAWATSKDEARAYLTGQKNNIARAAAETAAAAERMSEPAKRAYHRKSAETPTHVTE
jgi:hypothetical protein